MADNRFRRLGDFQSQAQAALDALKAKDAALIQLDKSRQEDVALAQFLKNSKQNVTDETGNVTQKFDPFNEQALPHTLRLSMTRYAPLVDAFAGIKKIGQEEERINIQKSLAASEAVRNAAGEVPVGGVRLTPRVDKSGKIIRDNEGKVQYDIYMNPNKPASEGTESNRRQRDIAEAMARKNQLQAMVAAAYGTEAVPKTVTKTDEQGNTVTQTEQPVAGKDYIDLDKVAAVGLGGGDVSGLIPKEPRQTNFLANLNPDYKDQPSKLVLDWLGSIKKYETLAQEYGFDFTPALDIARSKLDNRPAEEPPEVKKGKKFFGD